MSSGSTSGSPCGACKFLRRKCVKGCVFAPYFCHEQGASHFAAIHKVFGASNASKLLSHLPVADRPEAAITISYEAQARLQDPIYGCVSHIFALQQQVINLRAQLASLKEQAAQTFCNSGNPNYDKSWGRQPCYYSQDVEGWLGSGTLESVPQFPNNNVGEMGFYSNGNLNHHHHNLNPIYNQTSILPEENMSSYATSFEEGSSSMDSLDIQTADNKPWPPAAYHDDRDDLQSVAFRYLQHH
ncbi:PREDICTED: LOB domain-containing protein 29-like [Ipomoea nil]|uniref:LOB domain-containing protein 29-like n=1 Tax=Ipomoea nil TaxID=35883 RepID=UPI0009010B32|nr:PREDICTED: LOB domain-containing protein 29-like [Ipomoea nil]